MVPFPADVVPYKRTAEFTEATVPAGLLRRHVTKPGAWGRIVVVEGALWYRRLDEGGPTVRLVPGVDGVVLPEVPHEVEPDGPVRFYVEFLARPTPPA